MTAATLVDLLKRHLKARGITYAQVATRLALSEASVKRMFSRQDFTLQRMEDICHIAGIDLADLARELTEEPAGVTHLTVEQEQEIVSDTKLMLVALCAVGNWTLEQIVDTYDIPRVECIGYLARLDRQRIIELLPDNRIRPLIHRTFAWRPDGPIKRYFRSRMEAEYLSSTFRRADEAFLFVNGMLSAKSTAELIGRLRKVAAEFAEMHRDDLRLLMPQRHGTSVLLAIRPWEPRAFRVLRRPDRPPVPAGRLLHPTAADAISNKKKGKNATRIK
jgi:transcriptional regulator with XRE-family HTH domain